MTVRQYMGKTYDPKPGEKIETGTLQGQPAVWLIKYEGCVLGKREVNGYNDSDYYVTVWDETAQKVLSFEYDSTRGADCGNTAHIDATMEVFQKAHDYYLPHANEMIRKEWTLKLAQPSKGHKAQTKLGTGSIFWVGEFRGMKRVGVSLDAGGKKFFSFYDVTVLDPDPIDEKQLDYAAEQWTQHIIHGGGISA